MLSNVLIVTMLNVYVKRSLNVLNYGNVIKSVYISLILKLNITIIATHKM